MEKDKTKEQAKAKEGLALTAEELQKLVTEKAKEVASETIQEQLAKAKPQVKIYGKHLEEATKVEKKGMFYKALQSRNMTVIKALTTSSVAGIVAPADIEKGIRDVQENYGVARQYADVRTTSSSSYKVSRVSGRGTAYWVDEANSITASDVSIATTTIAVKKLAALQVLSSEAQDDSLEDLSKFVERQFATRLSQEEDNQLFNGTGSPFTGILNDTSVNIVQMSTGNTSFDNVTYDYIAQVFTSLPSGLLPNARWYMHSDVWRRILTMKDSNNRPLIDTLVDGAPGTLWGKPIVLSDVMPDDSDDAADTAFLVFGDLREGTTIAQRKGLQFAYADQATIGSTNLFDTDQIAIRVIERIGLGIAQPNALVVLKTSAT